MEGYDRSVSSSTPTKSYGSPKLSEFDENGQIYPEMGANLQNPRKPTAKNFMSTTISAASKATLTRKKILAESNQTTGLNFSHTHVQKTQNFDSKATSLNPAMNSNHDSLSYFTTSSPPKTEFEDKDQNTLVAGSSLRPYDPLTNYLSPRPKFLRYKPDRLREIFQENEIKGQDGLSMNRSFSVDSGKVTDEETDLVSTCGSLVASSQDAEEFDESDDEIEGREEGCWSLRAVLEFLLVFVVLVFSTLYVSSMNSDSLAPPFQSMGGIKDGYLQIHDRIFQVAKSLEVGNYFFDERKGTQLGLMELNHTVIDEGIQEKEIVEDNTDESSEGVDVCEHETTIIGEVSGQMAENVEMQETETVEKFDSLEDDQIPRMSDGVDHWDVLFHVPNAFENEAEVVVMKPAEEIYNEEEGREDEMVESEIGRTESITDGYTNFEILNPEGNPREELMEHADTELLYNAVIGVSLFSVIVACLVLRFHVKQTKIIRKDSPLVTKTCTEYAISEKCSSVLPSEKEKYVKGPDSFSNPISLINPAEEDSRELYQSQAPTVELLGEFEVGEISTSLRSCGIKSRMIDSEVSSHSVSMEKGLRSKVDSVPIDGKLAFSEFSAINSPSYGNGSFTAEKKILKKEVGGDGEAMTVVTTPVRRSSRIRSRGVMSP